jgi:hypothetical protein
MEFLFLFIGELILLFFLSQLITKSLSSIFLKITKSSRATIYLLSFLFLPGVIIHELAHVLAASLLFVRVGNMEFVPVITDDRVKLGGVQIEKTGPFRRALIGLAPVFIGGIILLISLFYSLSFFPLPFAVPPVVKWVVELYILFEIGNTMFSSKKDLEGTIELLAAVIIILLILFAGSLFAHSDVFTRVLTFLFSLITPQVSDLFRQMDYLLLIPLGLDILIASVTRIVGK